MKWKDPPPIKLYEALGTIGDGRIELAGATAKVWSSSRDKAYDVRYDAAANAIMTNDNGSYWQGYLGYPAIAYLLATGVVPYDAKLAEALRGFGWKEINTRNKNDWDKSIAYIRDELLMRQPEFDLTWLDELLQPLYERICGLGLEKLGPRQHPPA